MKKKTHSWGLDEKNGLDSLVLCAKYEWRDEATSSGKSFSTNDGITVNVRLSPLDQFKCDFKLRLVKIWFDYKAVFSMLTVIQY